MRKKKQTKKTNYTKYVNNYTEEIECNRFVFIKNEIKEKKLKTKTKPQKKIYKIIYRKMLENTNTKKKK